ncbi:hypothetical protein AOLI_G00186080 [Acnodon oligacanthus]
MSAKGRCCHVARLGSQSSRTAELMNARLDKESRKRVRTLKISKALFRLADRKGPGTASTLSRKRAVKDCGESGGRAKRISATTLGRNLDKKTPRSKDTASVPEPGASSSAQDVFSFPSGSVRRKSAVSKDFEVKQSVLKTVSRMLEENRAIRQRWLTLSQVTQKA